MKKTILALLLMVVLSIGATAQAQQPAVMDAILSSITEINKNITGIQTDIASMKTDIAVINTRLTTIEGTLERQNNRMDVVDSKVDGVDNTITQIQAIQTTTNTWLFWTLAIVATILGYFFMVLLSLKQKESNAIRSSSEPERVRVRQNKRSKVQPAT